MCRGRCALQILDGICYHKLSLALSQESVGITVTILVKSYTTITLYSSESSLPLSNIIHPLHTPIIITYDSNNHHTYWGSNHTDAKDRILLKFVEEIKTSFFSMMVLVLAYGTMVLSLSLGFNNRISGFKYCECMVSCSRGAGVTTFLLLLHLTPLHLRQRLIIPTAGADWPTSSS